MSHHPCLSGRRLGTHRTPFQAAIVLAIGATAHKYLRVRRDDNSVVKTNPAFEGSDLTVCNAWPDGDGELFAGQPLREA